LVIGDQSELIELGWSIDDRDSAFCPKCSGEKTEQAQEATPEEMAEFAEAVEKEAEPSLAEKEAQRAEAVKAQAELYGKGWNARIAQIKKKVGKKAKLSAPEATLLERHEQLEKLGALQEFFTIQATEIVRQRMAE
jgi:hypothetical protein